MEDGKIKVLHVLGSLNRGGAESRIMDVYRRIDQNCVQFDFLIFSPQEQAYEQEVLSMGAKVFRLNMPGVCNIPRHLRELRTVINSGAYDAVHAHTSYHCGLVLYAAWREHVPIRIAHARTSGSQRNGIAQKLFMTFGKTLIMKFATHRFAVSSQAGRFLYGSNMFEVLPNAIDVERYKVTGETLRKRLRAELNIQEEAFVIGQIGRFDPMKNHIFSLNWFRQFKDLNQDAVLVLTGEGPLKKEIQALGDRLGIDGSICFTGTRSDIPEFIHILDVLLLPSRFEGLPGIVLEAQASGIPAVISDVVSREVDMDLGLVSYCSLSDPYEFWNKEVNAARSARTVDDKRIREAFQSHHYSLEQEIEILMEAYREVKR